MPALHDIVTKDSTDRSVVVSIIDSSDGTPETGVVYNTSGIDLWYRREGAAKTSITEATLASLTTAHSDGGFLHISDGDYRLDLPDAAFATGANYVDFGGTVTGMVVIGGRVRLVDYDLEDSVRMGMTALPNAAADAAGGLPISDAGGLDLDGMNTNVSSILTDTAEIGAAGAGLTAIPWNASWDTEVQSECNDALVALNLDHLLAVAESSDVVNNSVIAKLVANGGTAAWADYDNTTMSLESLSLNTDTLESGQSTITSAISALNDVSTTDLATALTDIGLDHLVSTSVAGADVADDSIIASMVSSGGTADWDTFVNTTDSLQAVRDRGDSAWTTGAGGTPPQLLQSTTIATLASQTSFTLTAGSADDDAYNGHLAIVTDQSTSTQKCVGVISDYTGSSKTITLDSDPGVFTMATGDSIDIVAVNTAASAPTVTQIRQEMDSNSTQLAAIVADTNELQTNQGNWLTATGFSTHSAADVADAVWDETQAGHTTADTFGALASEIATLDSNVDAILVDTNELQTNQGDWATATGFSTHSAADVRTEIDSNSTQLSAIVADTNELQGDWTDGGRLDLIIDAILADTNELQGDDVPSLIAALNDLSAAEVNAEVVDALNVDTYAEPGQGTPAATATLVYKIGLIYKALRNKVTQDASTFEIYNDDATTVDHKATVSDDGTDFTRNELTTGP